MVKVAARAKSRPSADDRAAQGRALRAEVPRSSHGDWAPASGRPDPITLLDEQARSRVAALVPSRCDRMADPTSAFYRGAAYVMASDLAGGTSSGIRAQ